MEVSRLSKYILLYNELTTEILVLTFPATFCHGMKLSDDVYVILRVSSQRLPSLPVPRDLI